MDKEIIIDGVNVKDCKRRTGKNSYCRYFKRPCADNNFNCIWKQCERLKAENERLKEEIKEVKKYQYQQEYLDKEIKEMQKALKTLAEGLNKRQILLQEIKAIATECTTCGDCCNCKYCEDCDTDLEEQALGVCRMILDLITKAESEG